MVVPCCAEPDYFTGFTLVIATGLPEATLLALAELLHSRGVPLIVPRSYGLLGSIRLQLVDHTIVESKPDTEQFDLRLANPFPELEEFATRLDMSKMDDMEHAHTPYVVILLYALKEWKQGHGGILPSTFDEKNEFKEL
jgi:amyloid beta precursor protein binding protein 1